jgi:hypothetical protein
LDFTVSGGRIHYKDFTMVFADNAFDLVFYGSVGFDDTLDLVVSVPVRESLLKALGVKGPVGEYARRLAGTRVNVPIVGTREKPKLDFAKVDTKKLLEDVIKQGLFGIGDLLGEGDSGDKSDKGKKPAGAKSKDGESSKDKRGLGTLLEKLRRKSKERRKSGDRE